MSSMKIIRTICSVGVLVGLVATVALAETFDKRTVFTFNRPIALPGVTLPAGQYLFRLADPNSGRKVIHVLSADGKKSYAILFSLEAERLEASGNPEVRFMETAKGQPSAVKTWWYPNERIGYEFIYPKEQARLLARASVEPVLTTKAETTKPAETKTAELERLTPAGEEAPVAAVPKPAAPTGASQTGTLASSETVVPEGQVARNRLPQTASNVPLVGLIGILALMAAGGLRLRRTVRG
jgi:LPXTG-motif cell wall-anchored protein